MKSSKVLLIVFLASYLVSHDLPSLEISDGDIILYNDIVSDFKKYIKYQQQTDQYFKDGNYKAAFKGYIDLAETNDKYAQYKLAYMYYMGVYVEKDLIEAFAWSYVASENKQKKYINFYEDISKQISGEELANAQQLAIDYRKKSGNLSVLLSLKSLMSKKSICERDTPVEKCRFYNPILHEAISEIISGEIFYDEFKLDEYIVEYSTPLFEYSDLEVE